MFHVKPNDMEILNPLYTQHVQLSQFCVRFKWCARISRYLTVSNGRRTFFLLKMSVWR